MSAPGAAGDELTAYLDRPGLESLLAVHLEEQFKAAREPQQRQEIAQRLAALYARLLEQTRDADEVARIEERGKALLETITGADGDELRLALLGARHRHASRTMELHRMRAVAEEDVNAAMAAFRRMLPELERIDAVLSDAIRTTQQRLSRSGGVEATVLADRLSRVERLMAQTSFLRAWAMYYVATLDAQRGLVADARTLFATLLELPNDAARVDDVSLSLLDREPYARSVLGMALIQGLRSNASVARPWLELLEHESAHVSVRSELPAWRLAIFIDAEHGGDFRSALEELNALLERAEPVPASWLRLAAARGLEAAADSTDARLLAGVAVGALASRGEVAQVIDLARRFGGSALGQDGFVLRYVRGIERFESARERHAGDEPTEDPEVRQLYADAEVELKAALANPDMAAYREGASACWALLGWCAYYRGLLHDAAKHFADAAKQQRPTDAAESRWMAIVSLDRLSRANPGSASLRRELEAAIDEFLAIHPSSPRAGRLALRRALDTEPTPETLEALRQVPPGSDAYVAAQRQIVQVLYGLVRNAEDARERIELAREFLAGAMVAIDDDNRRIAEGDDSLSEGRLVRIRQAIEVALMSDVGRHALARELLDRLAADPTADSHASEIAFRRVQLGIAEDDLASAERWADALASRVAEAEAKSDVAGWFETAARMMFRAALLEWRRLGGDDLPGPLAAIDRWGSAALGSALAETEPAARRAALGDPRNLPVLVGVAEVTARHWRMSGDPGQAERAEALLRAILEIRPDDEASVRWLSIVLEGTGRVQEALTLVRRLLAGSPMGSEAWFEARYRQIDMLRRLDPARARAVMNQHRALHPSFGPPPWDERFEALDARIADQIAEPRGVES